MLFKNINIKNDLIQLKLWCSRDIVNHSVARQCMHAYTVVRATQQVNGKWQFWGCQNSVIPEPID